MAFGLSGDISNSNTSTTGYSNNQTTGNFTPFNPGYVVAGLQGLSNNITGLAAADPHQFVANANGNQNAAYNGAFGIANQGPGGYSDAFKLTGMGADTGNLNQVAMSGPSHANTAYGSDFMNNYLNPYTDQVVNSSLANFDQNAGLQRAQQQLDYAGNGAFGGSGAQLGQSLLAGQQGLARGQLESGLRSNAFNTAAGYGLQDASNANNVNVANANLGQQNKAQELSGLTSGLGLQQAAGAQLGALQSGYTGNQIAANQNLQNAGNNIYGVASTWNGAPLAVNSLLSSAFGSLPNNLTQGYDTRGTNNTQYAQTTKNQTTKGGFGFKLGS